MFQEIYEYSTQPYMMFWTSIFCIMGLLTIASLFLGDVLDLDIDSDTDISIEGAEGGMHSIFSFFDLGHVPITFLIFIFSSVNWGMGIILNSNINTGHSQSFGALLLIPVLIASFFITKIINIPVKKLYKAMNGDNEVKTQVIGNICNTNTEVDSINGYATVSTGTSPVQIMVYCEDKTIDKNKTAVVVEFNKTLNRYSILEIEDDEIFQQ